MTQEDSEVGRTPYEWALHLATSVAHGPTTPDQAIALAQVFIELARIEPAQS